MSSKSKPTSSRNGKKRLLNNHLRFNSKELGNKDKFIKLFGAKINPETLQYIQKEIKDQQEAEKKKKKQIFNSIPVRRKSKPKHIRTKSTCQNPKNLKSRQMSTGLPKNNVDLSNFLFKRCS